MKIYKKTLALLMLLAVFLLCPAYAMATAWDGTADTDWYSTDKTTFEISTAEQLAGLGVIVAGDNGFSTDSFSGKTVKLTADIDLGGKPWEPIGRGYAFLFAGELDGQGHSISNLCINKKDSDIYVGLFSVLNGAVIRNLTIASGSITSTECTAVGAIAGMVRDNGRIINCVNKADVVANHTEVGGIVGTASDGNSYVSSRIIGCTNYGTITSEDQYVGGICGNLRNSYIWGCRNMGKITGSNMVGGIAGILNASQINDCYNMGEVTADKQYAGGIFGATNDKLPKTYITNYHPKVREISSCYNTGKVSVKSDDTQTAGLLGGSYADNYDCIALADGNMLTFGDSGEKGVTATVLKNSAAKLGSSYTTGSEYPVFTWHNGSAMPDDLTGFAVETIASGSSTGCTVVMNKRLGYEDLTADDITLTLTVNGKKVEPVNLSSKLKYINYNGKTLEAMEYTWYTVGSNKTVTVTAAYKDTAAKTVSLRTPHTNNWLYYAADEFAGGSGSWDDPYLISTPEELARMFWLMADNSTDGIRYHKDQYNFKLIADIDLSAKRWQSDSYFRGTFDGNGHTISNLHGTSLFGNTMALSSTYGVAGLPAGNQISNLTLKNADVVSDNYSAGILGSAFYDCSLINCVIEDSKLYTTLNSGYIGALCGAMKCQNILAKIVVSGCEAKNVELSRPEPPADKQTTGRAGGLIGEIDCYVNNVDPVEGNIEISNCKFSGTINNYIGSAGGIVFSAYYTEGFDITNCIVEGVINNNLTHKNTGSESAGLIATFLTSSDGYYGENGINIKGNVVNLSSINGVEDNIHAINKDLPVLIGAGTARLSDNWVAADMQFVGDKTTKVTTDESVPYGIADTAKLSDKSFWESIGYDFSEDGLWCWNTNTNTPELRHDKLRYATGTVLQQPVDARLYSNQPAYFGVVIEGGLNEYEYQWQYSKNGKNWQNISAKNETANQSVLEISKSDGLSDGSKIRCIISQPYVEDIITDTATLKVMPTGSSYTVVRDDLLNQYQQRGTIENALEVSAIYAAGGDPAKLANDHIFYKQYLGSGAYGYDFYTAVYDALVLDEDITAYDLVWSDKTERINWIDYMLNNQDAKSGILRSRLNGKNDITAEEYAVSMIAALEMFFGGNDWGNEPDDDSDPKKLGRTNGINAMLDMVKEDRKGNIWFSNSSDYNNRKGKVFEATQAEFVMLMCRLADDATFGTLAKENADKVLNSLITVYDSEHANNKYTDMKNLRANAEMVSALVAYADTFATDAEKSVYINRAKQIFNDVILASGAVGGGYSINVYEHDLTSDAGTTAAVLMAAADLANGEAFLTEYQYDMAADVAVQQVFNTIKFPLTISADLDLATQGAFGTTLSWTSSNPAVISNDGKVTRTSTRNKVNLTLTATKGDAKAEQTYTLTVRALGADDNDDVDEALAKIAAEFSYISETVGNIELPESKVAGVTFAYASSDATTITPDGKVTRPAVGTADKTVTMTLTANKGSVSKSITQSVLVYAASDLNTPEGKIREAYLRTRTGFLQNRDINGYWNVFGAYAVLGDYLNPANGYNVTLPEPADSWYGTQYGAMVMAIAACGENPYNYRGQDWVALLNQNYGGMYAAGIYSNFGIEAAGADPAIYKSHTTKCGGASLTQSRSMGLDIAGWGAVPLAAGLVAYGSDMEYLAELRDDFISYLINKAPIDKTGNFANSNAISTNCVLLGLNALYWAGAEEANPLADTWVNSISGKSIVDASYDANWSGTEFGSYSGQAMLTFGDLYTVLYKGGTPAWIEMSLSKDKLDKQIAKAEELLQHADLYTEESVSAVKSALNTVKSMSSERLNATLVPWGREYYDLYDAVRYAEKISD